MTVFNRRKFLGTAGVALATISQTGSIGHSAHKNNGKIKVGQLGVGHAHASKLLVYRASAADE